MTGKIPSQHGVHDWIRSGNLDREEVDRQLGNEVSNTLYLNEKKAITYLEEQTSYTDLLHKSGYQCALSGKWHLGDSLRKQHGFDYWYTIARGGCSYQEPEIVEDGEIKLENRYVTELITNKALSYLDIFSQTSEPFYLSVHYTAPHDPWDEEQHPEEFYKLYEDCDFTATPDLPLHPNLIQTAPSGTGTERKRLLRGYYAAISAMDYGIGMIIDRVEELNLTEKTLICFTSDNGMNMGHHGIWGKGNGTFPLNLLDTSVKVPFIVSLPGEVRTGVSNSICSHYDLIHTFNEFLALDETLPEDLPGRSFYNLLKREENASRSAVVFDEYGSTRMIRTDEWKYIHRYPYRPHELYNISADPDENTNLITKETLGDCVIQLRAQLTTWFLNFVDPNMDGTKEAVQGFGQLCQSGSLSDGFEPFASE